MRNKSFSFFFLSIWTTVLLAGTGAESGDSDRGPLFREGPEKGFHLSFFRKNPGFYPSSRDCWPAVSGMDVWAMPETVAPAAARALPAAGIQKRRSGRAILILSGFILFETGRYWVESTKWREDWNFRFNWHDQKKRFFSLEANRFDSNPFVTNWTHLISGNLYYSMGRYYDMNQWQALLLSIGSSLWWEYVTEWREVISVNDNIFSGLGGMTLAEPLFQIGNYFSRRRGILNKVIGGILNPVIAFNDAIGGRRGRTQENPAGSAKPRLDVSIGREHRTVKAETPDASPSLHFRLDAEYFTIPGSTELEGGDASHLLKKTMLSELSLDMTVSEGRVQEYHFFSRAVLCGYFRRKRPPADALSERGTDYFLGLASSFDLFKKRATAYYDKGEYHFDFAADERAPQPTGFSDKFAAVNLIGPMADIRLNTGAARFRLSLAGSADFALVNALALNPYSLNHDIYEPRMKTTLVHYGYYYAYGATLGAMAGMRIWNFAFGSQIKYQAYGSIEGRDRFQDKVADDVHLRDSRLDYRFSLDYSIARTPMALGLEVEGIDRRGSLHETRRREFERRTTCRLVFSF